MNQRILQMMMKQDYFFQTLCLEGEKCPDRKFCKGRLSFPWQLYD
jgi:hypothetical protein